jgi:hypothetical protein
LAPDVTDHRICCANPDPTPSPGSHDLEAGEGPEFDPKPMNWNINPIDVQDFTIHIPDIDVYGPTPSITTFASQTPLHPVIKKNLPMNYCTMLRRTSLGSARLDAGCGYGRQDVVGLN